MFGAALVEEWMYLCCHRCHCRPLDVVVFQVLVQVVGYTSTWRPARLAPPAKGGSWLLPFEVGSVAEERILVVGLDIGWQHLRKERPLRE